MDISGMRTMARPAPAGSSRFAADFRSGEIPRKVRKLLLTTTSLLAIEVAVAGAAQGLTVIYVDGATLTIALDVSSVATLTVLSGSATQSGAISGSGSVTMAGPGSLALTGANIYAGGTTITGGTLQLGSGGTTGSIVGDVVDNSALVFDRSDTVTFSGVISGNGTVSQRGSGTLILTGSNSYTGGTTVDAGKLVVGNVGALGLGAVALASGTELEVGVSGTIDNRLRLLPGVEATLSAASGTSVTWDGYFLYSGSTLHIGSAGNDGTITLSYTGGSGFGPDATISVDNGVFRPGDAFTAGASGLLNGTIGTLNVGAAGTYDLNGFNGSSTNLTGSGTILNNGAGAAVFTANGGTSTFSGTIKDGTATVGLNVAGGGALTLTGTNTYTGGTTITSGTLQLGDGGTTGSIVGDVVDNGALVFDRSDTMTFSGVISGNGTVSQSGSGTLILTGSNTYTGVTTVGAGKLVVGNVGALGLGAVALASGTELEVGVSGTIENRLRLLTGLEATLSAASGTSVIWDGYFLYSGSTLHIGSAGNDGAITLSYTGGSGFGSNVTISVDNGVFRPGDAFTAGASGLTNAAIGTLNVGAAGTYDLNGFNGKSTNLTGSGTILNNGASAAMFTVNGGTSTFAGMIKDGTATIGLNVAGGGALTLTGTNTYTGGTTIASGTLQLGNGGTTGSIVGDVVDNGALVVDRSNVLTLAGVISGSGSLSQIGSGMLVLAGANTYTGGTTITSGTLQLGNGGATGSIVGDVVDNGALVFDRSDTVTFSGLISGSGSLGQIGSGTLVLTTANTYMGGTLISGGTLQLSGSGTLGAVTGTTTVSSGGTLDLGGTTQTQASVHLQGGAIVNGNLDTAIVSTGGTIDGLGGSASLTTQAGTTKLLGTNAYAGATDVNGGVLDVEGTITGTSAVTVNAGGILTGRGIIDPLVVTINSGATFAPGNGTAGSSISIVGNLAFASGAIYLVQIDPSTTSLASVTGTATLGGATVNAMFASGSYVSKTYTILTAGGGVTGTFAPDVVATNLSTNFKTSLSYDANNIYLSLALDYGGGLSGNQQAVANVLTDAFNKNGLPLTYGALNAAGLSQVSGELATGAQQATFGAMSQFMGLLTDPAMARNVGAGPMGGASGFADEQDNSATNRWSNAFAAFAKTPPRNPGPSWSVWATGFGGSQTTDGNVRVGSNSATSRIAGAAVGADYLVSANTVAGFALAGGGTGFSVNGLGSGRSDLFQAGAYVRHTNGPAYLSAALAYGWQDITTDRTVTIAGTDRLHAEFNANVYSGRIEGGYRFVAPWIGGLGLTPYAAAQAVIFDLPAYAESVVSGANTFALNYAGKSVTDTRSELGIRTDKSFALQTGVLTLRGRSAWMHDFNPDHSVAATFQALPGASFVVSGAAQARDAVLTTVSAEMKWLNGWSLAATFEGEFSGVSRSYAGKGLMRYQW